MTPPSAPDARRALLRHFDDHARDLPWRRDRTPYGVLVSELMLQQTRVETVVPYYRRWLERFPDIGSLAGADIDDVLQEWKGLGYYRRARNLHATAGIVMERFGGELPDGLDELRSLPGVGRYTAGAIASIAFGVSTPAVDGNVRRVVSRLWDLPDPSPSEAEARASTLIDPDRPGSSNEALMELGATVCTPRSPRCEVCPLSDHCLALGAGTVAERPRKVARKRPRRVEVLTVVVTDTGGRVLLRKRPDEGLLAGLWEFPGDELAEGSGPSGDSPPSEASTHHAAAAVAYCAGELRIEAESLAMLDPVPHAFTHLHVTYRPQLLRTLTQSPPTGPRERWIDPADLDTLPMAVAQQKIGRQLMERS